MTVHRLSRSGAMTTEHSEPRPMYVDDERNESPAGTWDTSEVEMDPDLIALADDPDFYEALLAARNESVHDAPTIEEAARWLAGEGQ